MKVIIVEDELAASDNLSYLLTRINADIAASSSWLMIQ